MGDFGEPGGALERLERMAYGAEEIRLATPEERGIGVPMRIELKTISSSGKTNHDAVERLKDAVCRYACDNGYRDFYQGEKNVKEVDNEFRASQRILYLERGVDDEIDKSLREFRTDLDRILGEMQERGLVREIR